MSGLNEYAPPRQLRRSVASREFAYAMKNTTRIITLVGLILSVAASVSAQPQDISGWRTAVWGMQEREIIAMFRPKLQKLKKRAKFVSTYADYVIPDYEIDGRSYSVYFEMANRTNKLSEVLVRLNEMKSKTPREDVFSEVEAVLTKTLGDPTNRNDLRPTTSDGSYVRIIHNRTWRFPTTNVELAYDWSNYIHSSVLGIRYIQAAPN